MKQRYRAESLLLMKSAFYALRHWRTQKKRFYDVRESAVGEKKNKKQNARRCATCLCVIVLQHLECEAAFKLTESFHKEDKIYIL